MPSIYDELVASSSALYGSEKAVETEQKMLEMRQKHMAYRQGLARENKQRISSRVAGLLGLLSRGYKEVMETRALDKSFKEMSQDPDFGVTEELWKSLNEEEKYAYKYDWERRKKQSLFDKMVQSMTPQPSYGLPSVTNRPIWEQEQYFGE